MKNYIWLSRKKGTKKWESSPYRFSKKEAEKMARTGTGHGIFETKIKKLTRRQKELKTW